MIRAIGKHLAPALWLLGLVLVAVVVGGYIVSHQRLTWPTWTPLVGKQYYRLDARFTDAAGVLPGQGNAVMVSGVKVGEITGVHLDHGTAVLDMRIDERFGHVRPDATLLMRPKTSLQDMVVELDPGTAAAGPELRSGTTLGIQATEPDVNFDQILASLDADTRAALQSLLGDAGTALGEGNGRRLSDTLKRFEPLSRDAARATRLVAQRRTKLKRLMGNLSSIADELGRRDDQLGTFVSSSAAVFRRFAAQNQRLGETLSLLPPTLDASTTALRKVDTLSGTLQQGLSALAPTARSLGPALRDVRPFVRTTTPIVRDELRPFAREAQPTARKLVPAARDLAAATPHLKSLTDVLNAILDELAFDPPGNGPTGQSYLFQVPWASHDTNSVLSGQDGVGPTRRGMVLLSCGSLQLLESLAAPKRNPTLSTLIQLLNAPKRADVCPGAGPGAPAR